MHAITKVFGEYERFFSDLLHHLDASGIEIRGMPLSHLLYRTATTQEYEALRDQALPYCSRFVETQFNARAVSILVLQHPLLLEHSFAAPTIELPAPRPAHRYPSGWESIGVVVGNSLPQFNAKYERVLTGIKEHGIHCRPSFITFENGTTAKFYDTPLTEIVQLQGWKLEDVS